MAELPEWNDRDGERKHIEALLKFVRKFLKEEIDRLDSQLYDRERVREFGQLLKDAWIEAEGQIEEFFGRVGEIPDSALKAHGLYGSQLELKYKLTAYFWRRFRDRPAVDTLRDLLDWINKILPSIFGALAGIPAKGTSPATFLDEIKKCLEALVRGMTADIRR
ncbi:MAG: hypothetical protein NW216_02165 [Hyphomicrobium sp.]|nr:hypothetical protein [Hyphomicrobium sp.]